MTDEAPPPPASGQFNPQAQIVTPPPAPAPVASAPAPEPAPPPAVDPPAPVDPAAEALSEFKSALNSLLDEAEDAVTGMVKEFEAKLKAGQTEVDAITSELKAGGVVARLHDLELAVASHAGPVLMQAGHDGHALLTEWFEGIKERFQKITAARAAPTPAPQAPPPIA